MIIAQISDPHISQAGGDAERVFQTADKLARAVAHLLALPAQPDVVIITGDCVDDGTVAAYELLAELLRPLTMPVYVIPGNHDDRAHLVARFGTQGDMAMQGFVQYVVNGWPVRLIALDSHIPGSDGGVLCAERLQWLDDRLAEAPEQPTLLFLHHPPFPIGLPILDAIGLTGAHALGAIVARYPNVERIVAGHVHRGIQRLWYGTLAMTCASTSHQLLLDLHHLDRVAQVIEPPTCLLHVWNEAIGLVSHTSIIGEYAPVAASA